MMIHQSKLFNSGERNMYSNYTKSPTMIDTTLLIFNKYNSKSKTNQSNNFIELKSVKKENKMRKTPITVKIKLLRKNAKIPQYGSECAAACDLYAAIDDTLKLNPQSTTLIPTGISIEMPKGYAAYVMPRSGISLKMPLRIANTPGLIDEDYRGEIKVILDNIGGGIATIEPGMKLAQLMFVPYVQAKFKEVNELSDTKRGAGGFGSTGTK